MHVLVPVKRVIDPYVSVHVKSDNTGVVTDNVKMAINPFDEIAVEEAVRWKEAGHIQQITAITIGNNACQETLRHALALGADNAIHVQTEETFEPLSIAKILKYFVQKHSINLVILGKQAIDNDCNQTGQMLAALLDWPQGAFVSKVTFGDKQLTVIREIDGGLETISLTLPAVITTDLRLNEPRYLAMPNIMKAKRKEIDLQVLTTLGLPLASQQEIVSVTPPPAKKSGILVKNVEELVDQLVRVKAIDC